jgi:flagellar basal-body rod protein FlgF
VDQEGRVWQNSTFADDPERLVSLEENEWENIELVDRLKLVDFPRDRYLKKQGNSLWVNDRFSGDPRSVGVKDGTQVRQGFLEASNVNPVTQMVRMIEVNRAYEANQKVIQAHDQMTDKLINQAARV